MNERMDKTCPLGFLLPLADLNRLIEIGDSLRRQQLFKTIKQRIGISGNIMTKYQNKICVRCSCVRFQQ